MYRSLVTLTCTDLYVFEAEGNSTLHNNDERMRVHRHARSHVQALWAVRGTLHH